jgi:hypothetical protein
MKAPLILVVSERMDKNKKKDRNENKLIRMGEKARQNLGLKGEKIVELWPEGTTRDRISHSKALEIFQAYSEDIKKVKQTMSEEDYNRVGFVTSQIFNFICKDSRKKKENIWLSDTVEDTIIGADPEFLLLDENCNVKYAAEVEGLGFEDILGSDGPLAEIRPEPAIEVNDFIKNIHDILNTHDNTDLIQKYTWLGGCCYNLPRYGSNDVSDTQWTIGGHIHIGTPAKLAKAISNSEGTYGSSVYACLNKILDEYIAIPMMKADGIHNSIERRKAYGNYGGFKINTGRLEYRTLSGEWITHPKMAGMVIGAVKAIAHAFFKILDEKDYKRTTVMTKSQQSSSNAFSAHTFYDTNFCYWKNIEIMKIFNAMENSSTMYKILQKGEIEFRKTFFENLKKKFKSLMTYREYSDHIDAFLEFVSLPNKLLSSRDKDLRHTWVEGKEFIM